MTQQTSNVTNIDSKQSVPSCRFSITATLDGFPIEIQGEGKAGDLKVIVDRLKAIGAMPPQVSKPEPAKPAGDEPVCEFHGAMKRSNHGGFYCPKKMGDGSYCKSKSA